MAIEFLIDFLIDMDNLSFVIIGVLIVLCVALALVAVRALLKNKELTAATPLDMEQITQLQNQTATLQATLNATEEQLKNQTQLTADKEHQLQESSAKAQAQILDLTTQVATLQTANQNLTQSQSTLQNQVNDLTSKQEQLQQKLHDAEQDKTKLSSEIENLNKLKQADIERFNQSQQELESRLQTLGEKLLKERTEALDAQNNKSLKATLDPLKEELSNFRKQLTDAQMASAQQAGSLKNELARLQAAQISLTQQADELANALRQGAKSQGMWGELQLERVLDNAGLVKGESYFREVVGSDGYELKGRVDAWIKLPLDHGLIVDAKCSLSAYIDWINADVAERGIYQLPQASTIILDSNSQPVLATSTAASATTTVSDNTPSSATFDAAGTTTLAQATTLSANGDATITPASLESNASLQLSEAQDIKAQIVTAELNDSQIKDSQTQYSQAQGSQTQGSHNARARSASAEVETITEVDFAQRKLRAKQVAHLKEDALKRHIKSVREHIDELADKRYYTYQGLGSPAFVLMFVPIDNALALALRYDPKLYDYAQKKDIYLVSPSTIIPALRVIGQLWVLSSQNEKVQKLAEAANRIYLKSQTIAGYLADVMKSRDSLNKNLDRLENSFSEGKGNLVSLLSRFDQMCPRVDTDFMIDVKTDLTVPTLSQSTPQSQSQLTLQADAQPALGSASQDSQDAQDSQPFQAQAPAKSSKSAKLATK